MTSDDLPTNLNKGQKAVFKSRMQHMGYVLKNGKQCNFVNYRYVTDNMAEVLELGQEILMGHPQLYVDPNESIVDTALEDAIREAQARATSEVIRQFESKGSVVGMANAGALGTISSAAVTQGQASGIQQRLQPIAGGAVTSGIASVSAPSQTPRPVDPLENTAAYNAFSPEGGAKASSDYVSGEPTAQKDSEQLGGNLDDHPAGIPVAPQSSSLEALKAKMAAKSK